MILQGLQTGQIKLSKDITEFDIKIQYAISSLAEERGTPCDLTNGEIYVRYLQLFEPERCIWLKKE